MIIKHIIIINTYTLYIPIKVVGKESKLYQFLAARPPLICAQVRLTNNLCTYLCTNLCAHCLIAEWYGVWQEVAQVQQGLTLLVLGWVTAC